MRHLILLGAIVSFGCDNTSPGVVDGSMHDLARANGSRDMAIPPGSDLAVPPGADLAGTAGHIQNVFIILMENSNWANIKASASATYIKSLLPLGAHAENYKNPTGIHPSLPNYLWLEAGDNFTITADGDPSTYHQSTTAHLVTQLEAASISWKAYQEDIDGSTCPLTGTAKPAEYAPKHNPFIYFDDVTNTNDVNAARCKAHVRPYSELATDLSGGAVARYNFITPNLCNDMHGSDFLSGDLTCAGIGGIGVDLIKKGDDWLAANVPSILTYVNAHNGVLFIVWDEGEASSDGPIGMLALSPLAKTTTTAEGYSNTIAYTHSSMLRSVQEIFGVTPLLGAAASATDLSDLFTSFP